METFAKNKKIILFDKPEGWTPLQSINDIRVRYPELKGEKMAYAGRLDPAASGLLIILVGDECKNRDYYQDLEKTYTWDIAVGISTDSLDLFGLPIEVQINKYPDELKEDFERYVPEFIGEYSQEYPSFSSYTVKSKPLFWWAKEGRLGEIDIPSKKVMIKNLSVIEFGELGLSNLVSKIIKLTKQIKGDFRQEEIERSWRELFKKQGDKELNLIKLTAKVGSGTYIRSLSKDILNKLKIPGLSLNIKRISVGDFSLESINSSL